MPKLKLIPESNPKNTEGCDRWEFMGYDGFREDLDEDRLNYITFTINISPDAGSNYVKMRSINREIKMWETIKTLVKTFGVKLIDEDYYWSESDLLLRIYVPFKHPLVQAEYNKHYVTLKPKRNAKRNNH